MARIKVCAIIVELLVDRAFLKTQDQFIRIAPALPMLQRAESQLKRQFQPSAFYARLQTGQDVFPKGDQAEAIALLISGTARVHKIGETVRQITLSTKMGACAGSSFVTSNIEIA